MCPLWLNLTTEFTERHGDHGGGKIFSVFYNIEMKKLLTISALIILVFGVQGCQNNNGTGNATNKVAKKEAKYYCPMDASITADKPGTCPKCGMKLLERDSAGKK